MSKSIRMLGVVLAIIVGAISTPILTVQAQAATMQLEDVVYLKDGSIIRGIIVEQRPGESVLIRTREGNQFRYRMDQIEKLAKEAPVHPNVTAPAPKSVGAAVVLSVLLTGAGQGYNGQWGKAAGFFGTAILSYSLMGAAAVSDSCVIDDECSSAGLWAIVFLGNYIWCVVDAGVSASNINAQAQRSASLFVRPTTNVGLQRAPQWNGGAQGSVFGKSGLQLGVRIHW